MPQKRETAALDLLDYVKYPADRYRSPYKSCRYDTTEFRKNRLARWSLMFLARNEFSRRWIRGRVDGLVRQLSNDSRSALTDTIERGFLEGLHPRSVAKTIERNIGLTRRDGRAVDSLFSKLREEGISQTDSLRRSARYATTLRRKRALNIARTEMMSAQARGQVDSWKVAQRSGAVAVDGSRPQTYVWSVGDVISTSSTIRRSISRCGNG